MTTPTIPPAHFHTHQLGEEDRRPVIVTLLRCRLYQRGFSGMEPAVSPPEALLWDIDDNSLRTIAMVCPPATDLRAWNDPDQDAPPGWRLAEPEVGRRLYDLVWYTGHEATAATAADAYAADLSVLLVIITAAAAQKRNLERFGTPAFEPPAAAPTTPLNGSATHPLTHYAITALTRLSECPRPRTAFNPGIANRLLRGPTPLAEEVELPSPYPSHKNRKVPHLRITEAGRVELKTYEARRREALGAGAA